VGKTVVVMAVATETAAAEMVAVAVAENNYQLKQDN
jgi:hypothetical protein